MPRQRKLPKHVLPLIAWFTAQLSSSIIAPAQVLAAPDQEARVVVKYVKLPVQPAKRTTADSYVQHDKMDDYFEFADACPKELTALSSISGMKPWSIDEKAKITNDLERIFSLAPGVLRLAGWKRKLIILKASRLFLPYDIENELLTVSGLETPGAIVLREESLKSDKERRRTLAHELIHAADCANRIAYRKDWLGFSGKTTSRIRFLSQYLAPSGRSSLEKAITEAKAWPSIYGTLNQNEALAEFAEHLITAGNEKSIRQCEPLKKLFFPSRRDLDWTYLVREGMIDESAGAHESAIKWFRKASQIGALSPGARESLARKFKASGDRQSARRENTYIIQSLADLNVGWDDEFKGRALDREARYLVEEKKYIKAREILNQLIAHRPFDYKRYEQRALCNQNTNRRSEELLDLYYASTKCQPYLCRVRDFHNRPANFQEWIGRISNSMVDSPTSLWKTATVLGGLAKVTASPELRDRSLKAFAECSKSPSLSGCSREGEAELKLATGLTKELQRDCESEIQSGNDDPLYPILKARALEMNGQKLTPAEYKRLKDAVCNFVVYSAKSSVPKSSYQYLYADENSLKECIRDLPPLVSDEARMNH